MLIHKLPHLAAISLVYLVRLVGIVVILAGIWSFLALDQETPIQVAELVRFSLFTSDEHVRVVGRDLEFTERQRDLDIVRSYHDFTFATVASDANAEFGAFCSGSMKEFVVLHAPVHLGRALGTDEVSSRLIVN